VKRKIPSHRRESIPRTPIVLNKICLADFQFTSCLCNMNPTLHDDQIEIYRISET